MISLNTEGLAGTLQNVEFNEEIYINVFPDVIDEISGGECENGYDHYFQKGKAEGRLYRPEYLAALGYHSGVSTQIDLQISIDVAIVSHEGLAFIVGWVDDRHSPIQGVSVLSGTEGANTTAFGRCRRSDVENALNAPAGYSFGFWTVLQLTPGQNISADWRVRIILQDGTYGEHHGDARVISDVGLRAELLGFFSKIEYYGNRDLESFHALESGIGSHLISLNRRISKSIVDAAFVERFGPERARFKASVIVCLYGKHEFFFIQNLLFSHCNEAHEYEYVFVSNSPDLSEVLHKEARIADKIYGLNVTLITLPGNAGFSAANNVAARHALSDRVIFVNPDVFPISKDWVQQHERLVTTLPKEQTDMFGALLYYDDGTLMHGGMYFEIDQGLSIRPDRIESMDMIRVEHYGKGAPAWSDKFTGARPVPAITGAFISADRAWFEELGGFSEDHLFGHYEDADLCLRSLAKGRPVWMHDIRFWHLEGKGSIKRPEHEGGALVNRWLFSKNWGSLISSELRGGSPTHPLLRIAPAQEYGADL